MDVDALVLLLPDGGMRRHPLDGVLASTADGFVAERSARGSSELIPRHHSRHDVVAAAPRVLRRFVRMLVLDDDRERLVIITPPEEGAVAPGVVHMPEAPSDAAIVDERTWDALADWLGAGGRLSACSISDLARLATIATPHFAVLIGEVVAQRALEYVWEASGPLRGGFEIEPVLQPLVDAAKTSARAGEALISALSHAAGARRRRRAR